MKAKSKTAIFVIVSFFLGMVAGGFIGLRYFDRNGRSHRPPSHVNVMKEFTEKLQLSEQQVAAIDSILEFRKSKFGELRKLYSDSFKRSRDTLRMEIRKQLSEEQNLLYDAYIKEMEEREANARRRYR